MRFAIHLKATNSNSGNPRRIFAIFDGKTGHLVELRDEGYLGRAAAGAIETTAAFDITTEEYNSCKKDERFVDA